MLVFSLSFCIILCQKASAVSNGKNKRQSIKKKKKKKKKNDAM